MRALARLGAGDELPPGYRSAWKRAGLADRSDGTTVAERYAPSPRSTRGATRA